MKIDISAITNEELIQNYFELKSSYKVAEKLNTSATQVKRVLKKLGKLRTQSEACRERNLYTDPTKMKGHKKSSSMREKLKIAIKNSDKRKHVKHGRNRRVSQRRKEEYELICLKKQILKIYNFSCFNCGTNNSTSNKLVMHHIIPYSVLPKGHLDIENLLITCTNCHLNVCHNGNWKTFNVNLVTNLLKSKYSLCAERLNEMAGKPDAIVRSSDISKTEDVNRNDSHVKFKKI